MTDLFAARSQMAVSLGFHIIFAAIGIAMPVLMAIAHGLWLKTRNQVYLDLTRAWSKGVAIFFATGAVSGTVLSFELGLLWPGFMRHAGPIIGMPFSWEGAAFFLESVALGIFLYGWNRVSPKIHWLSGLTVGFSGIFSGLFVICANAWMNSPAGFNWVNGEAQNIDPWAAMFNPASLGEGIHMSLAAFEATGFAVAGIHAYGLLKHKKSLLHRKACEIALVVGTVAAILQPISGDLLAKDLAIRQPLKLAAMEALFKTSQPADLVIGGIPDEQNRTVRFGIRIPKLLSFLAHGDFHSKVIGLDSSPPELWPPILPVHIAFQIMVAIGTFLVFVGTSALIYLKKLKRRALESLIFKLLVFSTPLGFLAIEAGWTVTEVGRQPWIIYQILKTSEAVTPMPGLVYSMALFSLIYLFLTFVVAWLMVRQFRNVS